MNYKIIIYIITLTLFSAMIGGGAVYIATNYKTKPNTSETTTSSESRLNSKVFSSSSLADTISSSSLISNSSSKSAIVEPEEKPTGQKFTGWLGSTNIEMYLNFKQDKITGKYYNSYDKKWYTLDGVYQGNGNDQSGSISLSEFDGNLITGNFFFGSTNPTKFSNQAESNIAYNNNGMYGMGNSNYGLPAGLYYTNKLNTLTGSYSDKKGANYDLFVSATQADIDYFADQTKELKVLRIDSGNPGDTTMFEQNGKYYFTYEDWKIPKDTKVGDKLKITGKIRSFNNSQGIEIKPYIDQNNPNVYESTSQGIFQISDVKKI